jgi:AcrR family transcriptional regulator
MPKIIVNLESRLTEEARNQILTSGYAAMTVRSVAKSCGVGVGTVYNYFPSKDALIAAFLLEDWKQCVARIEAVSQSVDSPEAVARCICDQLLAYIRQNEAVFRDETAAASFAGSVSRYHGMLRSQLAAPLEKFCAGKFQAEFVAEALLTWTIDGKPFEEIYEMVGRLF